MHVLIINLDFYLKYSYAQLYNLFFNLEMSYLKIIVHMRAQYSRNIFITHLFYHNAKYHHIFLQIIKDDIEFLRYFYFVKIL